MQGVPRPKCPICKDKKLVPPTGPEDAEVLLCGPFPGYREIIEGVPWIGPAGKVLKNELAIQGIQFDNCRVTNLWQHEPAGTGTKKEPNPIYEAEINWHFNQLVNEFHGRKAILVMGALTAQLLGIERIGAVAGQRVHSEYFPKTVEVSYAMQNPAKVLHGLVGETRYAIGNFANEIGELSDD